MALAENSLFLREHELVIGPKVDSPTPIEPINALKFANRLNFSIEKTTTPDPNKSKITIYNISQESRSFLEQKDLIVFLKAGFNGDMSNIFVGEILRRESQRSGPEVTYTLECGDTERLLRSAILNIGLGPNATNLQVLNAAISQMGIVVGTLKGFETIVYKNGFSFFGQIKDLLTELTKNLDVEWNIQDGELRILPKGEDDGDEAVLITPETGLIGFPTKTIDGIKFTSLMNPRLRPGRAVKIESRQFQGQTGPTASLLASTSVIASGDVVKVRKATFKGDTYEGDWLVEVEAVIPRAGAI